MWSNSITHNSYTFEERSGVWTLKLKSNDMWEISVTRDQEKFVVTSLFCTLEQGKILVEVLAGCRFLGGIQ